jgi:hypothetical protein
MPARLIRAKAALLLAVFLSAGTSLPGLDSLLFHQGAGEPQRSQIHVEPAGGCLHHAEHCVLGRTATSGALATLAVEIKSEPVSPSRLGPQPSCLGRGSLRGGLYQPRAPPPLRVV